MVKNNNNMTIREWLLDESPQSLSQARLSKSYKGWLLFKQNYLAVLGALIILALVLCAVFAPWIAPFGITEGELTDRMLAPSSTHLLGTDSQGWDLFSRIVYGSRITLLIVAIVALSAPLIGLLVGTLAAYLGGWVDVVLMRITDIFLAFPKLILALAFVAALGPGIENAILAIALTSWPAYARMARAETLTIRNSDYISSIRLQGASHWRVLHKHIIPMCLSSLIVRVTLDMAGIILTAAGLGFLGLGAQPPMPEWGALISEGRQNFQDQWWLITFPGLAIFIVSLGFNFLGDGLRDLLDPRNQQK